MAKRHTSADPYAHKWWVLVTVCIAVYMTLLDGTVVNVSIPSISKGIGATFSDVEWVLNAYTLVLASFLVTFGRLGDMFGRKRFFIVGLALFGIGSLACGLSTTPGMLIAMRIVQALGGAFMTPATLSLTTVAFPPEQRGLAMGVWGAVSGLASATGPIIGGWLTDAFSWNYIFFINVPIVLLAIPFALWAIPESRDENPHTVDVIGAGLSVILLASLCYGLIEGPKLGWSDPLVLGLFGLAAVTLLVFVWWQRKATEPIMDLRLFRSRAFSAGNASGGIFMFGMMGLFFLVPIYLQGSMGYTPIQTGLSLMPMSVTALFAAPAAGRLSDKIGSRLLVLIGMLFASSALFWLSFLPVGATWQWLAFPLVLAGAGMGLVMPSMTSAVMSAAPRGEEGSASGILTTIRQVGGVMGVAVLGAVFTTAMIGSIVDAVPTVPGLPAEAVPYVQQYVEENGSQMQMGGIDPAGLQEAIPADALEPLVRGAVQAAADDYLPAPVRTLVVDGVMAEVAKGTQLSDQNAMMSALGPLMGQTAAIDPTADATAFMNFGMSIGGRLEKQFTAIGEAFGTAAKESFVSADRVTFRVASIVLLLGALLALFIKPGKNVDSTLEAIHIH